VGVVVEAGSEGDDVAGSVVDGSEVVVLAGGSVGAAVTDGSLPGLAVEQVESAQVGEGESVDVAADAHAGHESASRQPENAAKRSRRTHAAPQQNESQPDRPQSRQTSRNPDG
jgi:hypothetical protein